MPHQGGEACVCAISDVGVSRSAVSHHLKKLKEAGLLISERRGTWRPFDRRPADDRHGRPSRDA
ncbi:hypothetical protein GCM10018789_23720 [Streptomyces werraensis]|nr:hypothetical protein GCM10018789_23720 [Streptomyces werraensis]